MNRMRIFSLAASLAAATLARADIAYYEWHSTEIYEPGQSSSKVDGMMAYLVDADVLGQQSILTAVVGNKQSLSTYLTQEGAVISSAPVEDGFVDNTQFEMPSTGTDGHAFFVLQDELEDGLFGLYFSGYSTITPGGVGTSTLVMNAASSKNGVNWTTTFQGKADAGDGGGWYALPEPTSGMLILVGIALLGLRRREFNLKTAVEILSV